MASSTTRPIANTKPKRESVLMEKPKSGKKTNVPTRETGTANSGIRVARPPRGEEQTTRVKSANWLQGGKGISFITRTTEGRVSRVMASSPALGRAVVGGL